MRQRMRWEAKTVVKRPDVAEAERHFNYPYAAVEESLSNAVYHKGYDSREPIEVRVLPDRIEILSHPGADRSITIENLMQYRAVSRRYRNRRVGAAGIAERRERVLEFFAARPEGTLLELCSELGITKSMADRDVKALKQDGRLKREGSSFAGYWKVLE